MKFIDEVIIEVQAGDGGNGCVSFRRERFIPRGGPDGGDGGKGGDVVLLASPRKRTLHHFQFKRQFKAQNGSHGMGRQKTGGNGEDLVIEVPVGTLCLNAVTGEVVEDLVEPGQTAVIAKGGRGGQGNQRFKTSTNRAPRFAQTGQSGEALGLKLELKLLADVGLIGFPNAGKSTLISAISSATPKIGSYPFTTLSPNLGVVKDHGGEPFVVADIPGLIEGAHQGAGLGIRFLRHVDRTRILVHLIDASALDADDPLASYKIINRELALYGKGLSEKPQVVVLNKMDIAGTEQNAQAFESALPDVQVFKISAVTRQGVKQLLNSLSALLDQLNESRQETVL